MDRVARRKHEPSRPKGLPVVGHLLHLGLDPLGSMERWSRDHGEVVALRFGAWPALLVSEPDLIEQILVKEHRNFIKFNFLRRHVTAVLGNGLLTSEGDFWLRQRRLAAPAFAGQRLAHYGEVMVRHTQQMLARWKAGSALDLHTEMMALTLRIAAKTLFNTEVEDDLSEIDRAVTAITDEIASRIARPFVIPDAVPLPGHIRYRRGLRRIERVVAGIIDEYRSDSTDTGDLLSMLMRSRDEQGKRMSDRQLRDEIITMLLAGHETTALALSWSGYLLTRHPEVQDELSAEVREVLAGRPATIENLPRLRFAEHVVTETMRLYPPAWQIGREAVRDCEIGGAPVRAGTTIIISPWVVHRSSRWFDCPEAFRPERWESDLARRLPRFAYFPFGGGPRVCIGNRFATMEAVLVLATIFQQFSIERVSERTVVPLASITLRPTEGVWIRPVT